jgi:hypothetical protein
LAAPAWATAPGTASTPVNDPIHAGYQQLYSGDPVGAYEHFRKLAEREPDNLAAAYGVLMAMFERELNEAPAQAEFEKRAEELIRRARARYDRNKQDKEAVIYLAQVYGALANYKFSHDKGLWGAARDAAKAKGFAEESIKLEPTRADAYFALGLYNYYVDIAPSFIKFLRVFLFLPGGNRVEGLKQIERVAREGELWGPAAQEMLGQIYGWLEGRPEDALKTTERLSQQYPDNPSYQLLLARIYANPMIEDFDRTAAICAGVAERAEAGHPNYGGSVRYHALTWLARARQQQWRLEEAAASLTPVIDAGVTKPEWVAPSFLNSRGNYRALAGDAKAAEDFQRVLGEAKWKRWHASAQRLLRWMEERQKSGEAARYAELIPGNRLVAERRWAEALEFYEQARKKHPGDWQLRYRLAYLEFARGELEKAQAAFDGIVSSNPGKMPNWLKANSMLYLARVHDLRGRREEAVRLYKKIVDSFENEGAAGAARLGLVTPYRRLQTQAATEAFR